MTVGEFFAEHRKLIDARKADLTRVGIVPPADPTSPVVAHARPAAAISMPSQSEVLAMPSGEEKPMLDATHAPALPTSAPATYAQPKLPALLGVNEHLTE
ncbi:MAG TPA: hypothetical protein VM370_02275 [Candidatus Thermoplasmatota archaeon]|nr:hypothetical protein [Candidatus Thermoplasmatota archaeon]